MSSVSSSTTCKQCGYLEAYCEFQTRSRETNIFCPVCGWSIREFPIIDRVRSTEGTTYYKTKKNGGLIFRLIERAGCGAYWLVPSSESNEGVIRVGSFSHILPDNEIIRMKELVDESHKINWEESFITSWDNENKQIRFIIGKMPSSIEEVDDEVRIGINAQDDGLECTGDESSDFLCEGCEDIPF